MTTMGCSAGGEANTYVQKPDETRASRARSGARVMPLNIVVPARIRSQSNPHCWRPPLPHASALIQRDFGCVLGVQQTKQLPHVAKVDLVWQLRVTSVVVHNAAAQHPLSTVSPDSNPTIVVLQTDAWLVSKDNFISFCCPHPSFISPFGGRDVCGSASRVDQAMDVLRTDHSVVNGVQWCAQTLNDALQTQCAALRFMM
ncbi:hypothetical protein TNCV_2071391 [Trichonephila clavipes]|uniref:Uncharacterized protein n=1 Tax=Trichonephila clavipes TaxID=2585209 RepID=A0A8X6W3M3_TRICX|nr:hypothetical protein TNCV_2071391 [Trichonephila clavipes]